MWATSIITIIKTFSIIIIITVIVNCVNRPLLLLISINITIHWISVLLLAVKLLKSMNCSDFTTVNIQGLFCLFGWPWVCCKHWGSTVDGIAFVFYWFVPVCMMSVDTSSLWTPKMYLEILPELLGNISVVHRFWNSGNSPVTVETALEGMYRVMERMSKNKSEKMSSEIYSWKQEDWLSQKKKTYF